LTAHRLPCRKKTGPHFTYDRAGRMLTALSGRYANTVTLAYDHAGRLASEGLTIAGQTYSVGRTYDVRGLEATLSYPGGGVVQRTYTPRRQLQQRFLKRTSKSFRRKKTFVWSLRIWVRIRSTAMATCKTKRFELETIHRCQKLSISMVPGHPANWLVCTPRATVW